MQNSNDDYAIRLARADELATLQEVARSAGQLFATIGLTQVATDEVLSLDFLRAQQSKGLVWVIANAHDQSIGFAATRALDDALHLEEISVLATHVQRGLGRRLLEHVCHVAAQQGYAAITLTTFADVPWNAPFYARAGFHLLEGRELDGKLGLLLAEEQSNWAPLKRVGMRRDLSVL
jgi:GNAT superfamily N-acetyltransferase